MPIDKGAVKWDDTPDPAAVQWDAPKPSMAPKPKREMPKKTSRVKDALDWIGNQQLGIADGLQHRLMDIPTGIAQTVGNVVNRNVQVGATAYNRLTGQDDSAVSRYAGGVNQRNSANNQ